LKDLTSVLFGVYFICGIWCVVLWFVDYGFGLKFSWWCYFRIRFI